jgi:hypothetical protein
VAEPSGPTAPASHPRSAPGEGPAVVLRKGASAEPHPAPAADPRGPILAPAGASAATANRPDSGLDGGHYHIYESNPAPWWIGLLWLSFFVFGATYLILNLLR